MIGREQTEAERQAIEKAAAEKAAATKRTGELDARMNRLLRGQPSEQQQQQQPQIAEKLRTRLERIAADGDTEDAAWAKRVLSGKEDLDGNPIKRKPVSADGGEGLHSPVRTRSTADRFNDAVRDGLRAARWLPKEIDLS